MHVDVRAGDLTAPSLGVVLVSVVSLGIVARRDLVRVLEGLEVTAPNGNAHPLCLQDPPPVCPLCTHHAPSKAHYAPGGAFPPLSACLPVCVCVSF